MQQRERVGVLIVRVEMTGDPSDPLRGRVTWLTRLDDPTMERTAYATTRAELHTMLDRWLDAVALHLDAGSGGSSARTDRP